MAGHDPSEFVQFGNHMIKKNFFGTLLDKLKRPKKGGRSHTLRLLTNKKDIYKYFLFWCTLNCIKNEVISSA